MLTHVEENLFPVYFFGESVTGQVSFLYQLKASFKSCHIFFLNIKTRTNNNIIMGFMNTPLIYGCNFNYIFYKK